MDTYEEKYIKYKIKYNQLKEQVGSGLLVCPYCNNKIYHTKALEHIRIEHNSILTPEQLRQIVKDREKAAKGPGGKYNFTCKYCDKIIHSKAELSFHLIAKHFDLITEEDFNLIDSYISNAELKKSLTSRNKFVELEIKFNKIEYFPDTDKEQLANLDEIISRKQSRTTKNRKRSRRDIDLPAELPPFDDLFTPEAAAAAANIELPQLDFFDEEMTEQDDYPDTPFAGATAVDAAAAAAASGVNTDASNFELNKIPIDLLFESSDFLPIVYEPVNMNCLYCGLPFNRYNLAKHLLARHHPVINMDDLEFIKKVIPTGGPLQLRISHIILKIQRQIIERDRLMQNIQFRLPDIDLTDTNTFPSEEFQDYMNDFDPHMF
jgi:hypothetical protein